MIMRGTIKKLDVSGFKSIRELKDFELRPLNIFIGANGAGKSNLVQLFRMLMAMTKKNFQKFILENGGADNFLHNGPKWTRSIDISLELALHGSGVVKSGTYKFTLTPTVNETFVIDEEEQETFDGGNGYPDLRSAMESVKQDELRKEAVREESGGGIHFARDAITNWMVYHFHDTGASAPMRRSAIIQDCGILRSDGGNIAPFLLALKQQAGTAAHYHEIVRAIRVVMPFFDDFALDVVQYGEEEKTRLGWRQKGSDFPMQPYHLSDGSIRFICLATALLQPNPPSTIIIDEPELGLHPEAIRILGELMRDAAKRTQLVVATQSPLLLDQFSVEDIVVVRRENGQSVFSRLQRDDFAEWLEEYSVGDLWSRNVIQGGTTHE